MRCTAILLAVMASAPVAGAEPAVQRLYEGPAPGSEHWQVAESVSTGADGAQTYTSVRDPEMLVYAPKQARAAGTGVILLPGGALRMLVIDADVRRVIAGLNDLGVTVFVLKYRVLQAPPPVPGAGTAGKARPVPHVTIRKANANPSPDDPVLTRVLDLAVADASAALEQVRRQAPRWRLDPEHVGVLGYSAGGGVAIGTQLRSRPGTGPAFIATIYGPSLMDVDLSASAPPLFIATETRHGPVTEGLLALAALWRGAGRPVELHMFDVDAFSMPSTLWFERLAAWLAGHGLLPPGDPQARDPGAG